MISRITIVCLACSEPITTRVQVGHDIEQPVTFACPHCTSEIRFTLLLHNPPHVDVRWDENCEFGTKEGKIVNIGAGFTVSADMLHTDAYFPSFHAPRPQPKHYASVPDAKGPIFMDTAVAMGTLPRAGDHWRTVKQALKFHRTGQTENLNRQLDKFWAKSRSNDEDMDNTLFAFLTRFLEPSARDWLTPLTGVLSQAAKKHPGEFSRFTNHYNKDLKSSRFEEYSEIFDEYFKGCSDFSQTLIYVKNSLELDSNAVATSNDFDRTKMFYGNAFEVLGSHLDVPAALNNIVNGRPYDQMEAMDLKKFRSINKANRTRCFSDNTQLSWLVDEYDSAIRNASHHRWFRLNERRTEITYRSGGTGAIRKLTYAEYLYRCNQLTIRLMSLCCMELLMLDSLGLSL